MVQRFELPEVMVAARIEAPGVTKVTHLPQQEPGPGEVLIEVARAGVCGTDLHIFSGSYDLARYPLTPGHEFAGRVVAAGEGVDPARIGQRVTADPNIPCLDCPECRRNAFNQCQRLQAVGVTRDGAFATHLVVPERALWPIGELPYERAALIEPLACVAWGLERIRVEPGSHALVFGAGPMGCLLLQAVRAAGADFVAVVDISLRRLEIATALGADLALTPQETGQLARVAPSGFELVVDATGVPEVLEGAVAYTRSGGTVWVFGVAPANARIGISPYEFFRRDLSLVGSFALNRTIEAAISLIESGAVDVAPLVSHVLPLHEFGEGLRLAREDPERMKVQFVANDI